MSRTESFIFDNTIKPPEDRPGSLKKMVQCYQAASDYSDEMVGRLIDELDATGRSGNTIVVLWSDHGYHLGDKNACVKFTLWEKANRVPFIIVAPGVTKAGTVIDRPVSLLDIYPTLVELAGLPTKDGLDGVSLVPLLKDPGTSWDRPAIMTQGPGNHAVRTDRWRYIRYRDGTEELYDHDDDPWEHTNLAGGPEYAEVLAEHRLHLPKESKTTAQELKPKKPTESVRDAHAARGETFIANFENGTDDWKNNGTAFDAGERKNRINGFLGKGYINSYLGGDKAVGTLTSPPFKIDREHIKFLIGGGNHPGKVGMELLIDGTAVRTASGNSRKNKQRVEVLEWKSWEVSGFVGKEARIRIFDQHKGGWGHTLVDHIVQADRGVAAASLASSATTTNPAGFVPPPKPGVELKDEWSTFPLYDQVGYDQALRPQFHFTSRMGWLNDPNGMVYYDGEWHMLFQHFAKGNISGSKSWGNAVSKDLMHWQQLPHAINPYEKIDGSDGVHAIWSGSAVVDELNALGKQTGDTKTLFALYSATHQKFFQGGAYSTDKGRTWTKINDGKPVIPHQEGFSKGQRDPRIFYYEPGGFYVTIMMIGGPDRLVRLWKSTDLLNWEIIGDIPNKAAECIDMYQVAVDGDPNNRKWVIADAGSHYEVGNFDGKTWTGFGDKDQDDKRLRFDYGDAWYAAQAFNQGPDGRVVHVGWLRSKQPGYRPFLEAGMPFTQQMSIPIEITLRTTPDGIRMFRNPVKEIEALYHSTTELADLKADEANEKLSDLAPELIDLRLRFVPEGDFTLNVRGLPIRYHHEKQEFQFTNVTRAEGEKAAWKKKGPYRDTGLRAIPAPDGDGKVTLRVLVDRASLELFVNDGQAAASFVVVPEPGNRQIRLKGNDDLQIDSLVVNELKSAWGNGVAPAPPTTSAKPNAKSAAATIPKEMFEPVQNPRPAGGKPNIVLIFIDDMGYGDIGPFGSEHPTPNLDRMAAEGMKLTDFYVSSTACTPSRSALLTGCYANRIGMERSVVFPADERGLNPSEITIAEILKQGGYATGCFGKWHLGDQPEFMPLAQGFDVYAGIPYSNDMWVKGKPTRNYPPLPWMVQDKAVAHIPDAESQQRITDAITDAAVRFIAGNKNRPFFAYVPHSAVHAPFVVTPERLEAAGGDVMRALVGEIDASAGRILDALKQLGIDKNTLVFFTNDNGGAGKTSSGPLRGHKFGSKYEGHMRVATLARWPGQIPAGSVSSEIGATIDLLPTIAELAGQSVPDDRIIDGHDISGILLGKPGAKSPHKMLYYETEGIREGKWKLVRYQVKRDQFIELYDLEADLGEKNNIADKHPDIVERLKADLDAHVQEMEANIRPAAFVENPKPLLADSKGIPSLVEYLEETKSAAVKPASAKKKPTLQSN